MKPDVSYRNLEQLSILQEIDVCKSLIGYEILYCIPAKDPGREFINTKDVDTIHI